MISHPTPTAASDTDGIPSCPIHDGPGRASARECHLKPIGPSFKPRPTQIRFWVLDHRVTELRLWRGRKVGDPEDLYKSVIEICH